MTVFQEFSRTVTAFAPRPFLNMAPDAAPGSTPDDLSYGDAAHRVEGFRQAYRRKGYGLGHRAALILGNQPDFFLHFLALNALGVSVVPVDGGLTADEMRYLVGRSDACLVVTRAENTKAVRTALQGLSVPVAAVEHLDDLPPAPSAPHEGRPDLATEAAMLFTSGTTGRPKGCLLSNEYFIGLGRWYNEMGNLCTLEPGEERLITPLPVNHMNAMACSFMAMVMAGGCVIQLDRFHPSRWWESVRRSGATIIHYLGVMPAMLIKAPPTPEDDFSGQIKFGFGAGVDPKHHQAFEERFGFPLIEAWAMSETGAGACVAAYREPRHVGTRCFGRARNDLDYRLVDENGRDVAVGEAGELLVRYRGDNPRRYFFSGYYKDDEATAEAWQGGWFHTGDVVRVDQDGFFYFVDRRKNIIRRSGENIAAVEVEAVLMQSPFVASCAVAPVADEIRGEEVMALVVPTESTSANQELAEALVHHCLGALAYYKAPGYIAFPGSLPMTGSQKIQRGKVKRLCTELLEQGACFDVRALKSSARTQARGVTA